MRHLVLAVLGLCACATTHEVVRAEVGAFAVRDYLKTAYETLGLAETDSDGHRVRAQLATRAALDALGDLGGPARHVPFDGPPTMAVALELLERSEPQMAQFTVAQENTRRAVDELRAAVR